VNEFQKNSFTAKKNFSFESISASIWMPIDSPTHPEHEYVLIIVLGAAQAEK
jgi:hypothetical protein